MEATDITDTMVLLDVTLCTSCFAKHSAVATLRDSLADLRGCLDDPKDFLDDLTGADLVGCLAVPLARQ